MKEITINDLANINIAAAEFLKQIGDSSVIAFYGSMGAGKTTFITALCRALGVEDVVNSPTFTIVNEYADKKGEPIYHFDFYRINKLDEARDIGFDEYLYSGYLCLIEWPEMVEELLPEDVLRVRIEVDDDGGRRLTFNE
ncbi:MAG: tRNA (adenosine(37)-N6)-threonylcarbamoyltransferase complex ATPase subunit type 1 TsaE [Bacteroidales bacterium]|nr:tRNA (adenosine(37)-N6)-threonylcarbamoyltransferase complex ATPase subunit type 1 TsaE [Bacteroidales bacterium]